MSSSSTTPNSKYLSEQELFVDVQKVIIPLSTDTYNETEIKRSILQADANECFAIALQFSIIGMGAKTLGEVLINGEKHSVLNLCTRNRVNYKAQSQAKLDPSELTPKRLARFFRYRISEYIRINTMQSFLFNKYAKSGDPTQIFPGAEYMIGPEHASDLILAYQEVDKIHGTTFSQRIKQILKARLGSF